MKIMLTLCSQHGGFDGAEYLQLSGNRWNSLTNLQQICTNSLIRTFPSQLFGYSGNFCACIGYSLGRGYQLPLASYNEEF